MKKLLLLFIVFSLSISSYSQTVNQKSRDYFNEAIKKEDIDNYPEAIKYFSMAIKIDSTYMLAYFFRGVAKNKVGDYRGAITDFTKVIELEPKATLAYTCRGVAKIVLKDKESGCLDLSKAGEMGDTSVYRLIKEVCK